jgi:hypothetical protein
MKNKYLLLPAILLSFQSFLFSQTCHDTVMPGSDFQAIVQTAHTEVGWYKEWLDYTGGKKILPGPLPAQEKLTHSFMKAGFTSAMHEGPRAADVSNLPGPVPENAKSEYFHVLMKKESFSGMCPAFDFINDSTMVTLSFGRAKTTLLLLRVNDSITLLDAMEVPGRGTDVWSLIGKKGREKVFHNTAGGAYSYLSGHDGIYIPGTNNNILRVQILNDRIVKDKVESINLRNQMIAGNLVDKSLHEKDKLNLLTALMPDMEGNIWFTSRNGIIGILHRNELTSDSCMKVYATYIGLVASLEKIKVHFSKEFAEFGDIEKFKHIQDCPPDVIEKFRATFMNTETTQEEIQNSFSVGRDGVYIVTNYALYKLRFNEEKKEIELDPKWQKNFTEGVLIYDNDHTVKPGQLNAGSGTTPTLSGDRFVTICDNDSNSVNLCVFSQDNGDLVFKYKLFSETGGAVENSVVAYQNSIISGNTYGYIDVFKENPTPGGIARFDYIEDKKTFERVPDWPANGMYDCKSATPKLSTASGLIYVYNRADEDFNGHHDWQVTGIDYKTGLRVFYIKPYFNKGEFDDNISFLMRWFSLGQKNYDRKVFNNIWGTFTLGPGNSFYIGAYRGFLRVSSD